VNKPFRYVPLLRADPPSPQIVPESAAIASSYEELQLTESGLCSVGFQVVMAVVVKPHISEEHIATILRVGE
jgi:hypothetical protein